MINSIKKLSDLKVGERARVVCCENDPEISKRLNHLGLVTGAIVELYAGSESSNYLIGVNNTRIGLEVILTQAITVQQV